MMNESLRDLLPFLLAGFLFVCVASNSGAEGSLASTTSAPTTTLWIPYNDPPVLNVYSPIDGMTYTGPILLNFSASAINGIDMFGMTTEFGGGVHVSGRNDYFTLPITYMVQGPRTFTFYARSNEGLTSEQIIRLCNGDCSCEEDGYTPSSSTSSDHISCIYSTTTLPMVTTSTSTTSTIISSSTTTLQTVHTLLTPAILLDLPTTSTSTPSTTTTLKPISNRGYVIQQFCKHTNYRFRYCTPYRPVGWTPKARK